MFRPTLLICLCFVLVSCGSRRKNVTDRNDRETLLRKEIVSYAKQFEGVPYRYGGTSPRRGFDCSGFTSYVMDRFDLSLPRQSDAQERMGKPIKPEQVKPGDLIFYRKGRGSVFHVSLVVSNDRKGITVVHSVSRGVAIENISQSTYWKPKISTARDVLSK